LATANNEIDEIRRQMAQIRRELHQNVREVVANAEAVTDWRRYFRMYPWIAAGAAFTVGYALVPRRHAVVPKGRLATEADVAQVRAAVEDARTKPRKGLIGGALGVIAPLAVRAAQAYALQYLENWIAHGHESMIPGELPPEDRSYPSGNPNPPGGPYTR
jgi:hypothetical protein